MSRLSSLARRTMVAAASGAILALSFGVGSTVVGPSSAASERHHDDDDDDDEREDRARRDDDDDDDDEDDGRPGRRSRFLAGCLRAEFFEADDFPDRPVIDNVYLPMQPGSQRVLRGISSVTGSPTDHEVTFTVTDLVKVVNGVTVVVVYDVDRTGDTVSEAELAFFAQDEDGNVWNLGEYPEEYEDGEFVGAPNTWIAGTDNAEAGIHMLAEPEVGGPRYLQGWAPKIHFLDCAQVIDAGLETTTEAGDFSDVLLTDENNPFEPQGGSQLKYHAPGVGIVRIGFVDDPEGEELELVDYRILSAEEMDEVREAALELDARAYEEVEAYEDTGPAVRHATP